MGRVGKVSLQSRKEQWGTEGCWWSESGCQSGMVRVACGWRGKRGGGRSQRRRRGSCALGLLRRGFISKIKGSEGFLWLRLDSQMELSGGTGRTEEGVERRSEKAWTPGRPSIYSITGSGYKVPI